MIERAENKANIAKKNLDKNNKNIYEYIIGVDDGILIKGKLQENIKDYVLKILYENYLEENEEYAFSRAYCVLSKDNKIYKAITNVPYKYKSRKNIKIEDNSYPLKQVSVPLEKNKALIDLTEEEVYLYCLKYSKDNLIQLKTEINRN